MKRIATLAVMLAMAASVSATSVLYFTRSQAERAVSYLNRQNELMIYCGYDYEIETYVLLNEVWAERVNSAYYELWIYGYDAYTGEEIYMPIDLQCIWLYSAGHMFNAAQYLRFRTSGNLRRPARVWTVPAYNHYTRINHRPGYTRTYHYDVHRYGWMPPAPPAPGHHGPAAHPMHPYYMRAPHTPPPTPTHAWTPGTDRPHVVVETPAPAGSSSGTRPTPTRSSTPAATPSTSAPTQPQSGTATATPTRSSSTATQSSAAPSTTPTRSSTPSRSDNKSTSTNTTTTPTRSSQQSTGNSNQSATPTRSTTPTRSDNKAKSTTTTTAPTRSSQQTATPTRSSSTTNDTKKSSSQQSATPTRSSSTAKSGTGSATPTRR